MPLFKCHVCEEEETHDHPPRPEGWKAVWIERPEFGSMAYSLVWVHTRHADAAQPPEQEQLLSLF